MNTIVGGVCCVSLSRALQGSRDGSLLDKLLVLIQKLEWTGERGFKYTSEEA